jgi:hypothetical protein
LASVADSFDDSRVQLFIAKDDSETPQAMASTMPARGTAM